MFEVYGYEGGNTKYNVFVQFHTLGEAVDFVIRLQQSAANLDFIKLIDGPHNQITTYTLTMGGTWNASLSKLTTDKPLV